MNNFIDDRKAKVESFKKEFRRKNNSGEKIDIPDGLFINCEHCQELIYQEDLPQLLYVCPKCNHHFRLSARKRLDITCDPHTFNELFTTIQSANPLDFPDYEDKITKYQLESSELDAFVCGIAQVGQFPIAIGVLDSFFMMGSMGSAVGEKVTRLVEYATTHRLPLVIFSASGGARMQEGLFSLMQMAKTSAAIHRHSNSGLLYISVLTNPTTGGVTASFASLGDIILTEKGALIGFAGQRVIKQTIKQELPAGFQTADFQLQKGFVDKVLHRNDLRRTLISLISLHVGGD